MTEIADIDYQGAMADAVRGKLAEAGCNTITNLAKILGKSRPTAASRYHGYIGYTAGELETIARALDISVYSINDAARLRAEDRIKAPHGVARITPHHEADPWAQPARAKRRAS